MPRESSHFGWWDGTALQPMEATELYRGDFIGLRALNDGGRLLRIHAPGRHMQFGLRWFAGSIVRPFLAVPAADAPSTAGSATGDAAGDARKAV